MQLLAHKQAKYKSHFEDVFLSGQALDNDSQEINKCAREFIKIILQPIYPHVQFEDKAKLPDAVPLLEYLNQEKKIPHVKYHSQMVQNMKEQFIKTK
jgi:hypothetical protein